MDTLVRGLCTQSSTLFKHQGHALWLNLCSQDGRVGGEVVQ